MIRFLTVLAALFLAACSASENAPLPSVQEFEALNAAYDTAILAQDEEAFDRLFSERYRDVGPDGAFRGKQEKIASLIDPAARLLAAESSELGVEILGEDAALVTGRFVGRFMDDGEEVRFDERFSTVWVQKEGEWKVLYEQVSEIPSEDSLIEKDEAAR